MPDALTELAVLAAGDTTAHCRRLDGPETLVLQTRARDLYPGQIVAVRPVREWTRGRQTYLSGEIQGARLDIPRLGLTPLLLTAQNLWDPEKEFHSEDYEVIPDWAGPMLAWGPRRVYEMEQILPGTDPEDPWDDPIVESVDRSNAGDRRGARRMLMELCRQDLRCLDAHAHLGYILFDKRPADALRHYEVGVRIGELSLGTHFDGLLPWGWIDNRPFLRCLSGFGLCLWRMGQYEEAARVFTRMLWLNPSDNQGARFLVDDARAGVPWRAERYS